MSTNLPLAERQLLDLFELPQVFSQGPLLTVDQFRRELDRRGLWPIHVGQLEELHRTRLLQPLFRVVRDVRSARAAARRADRQPLDFLLFTPTVGWQLREYAESGALREARLEPVRPWKSFRRTVDDFPFTSSDYVYSRYQLLVRGENFRGLVRRMQASRNSEGDIRYRLHLREMERPKNSAREHEWVVVLSALESRYLPDITGRVALGDGGPDAWDQFERTFDPVALLSWLGISAEDVLRFGERLLVAADFMDPLGSWWELVRYGRRDWWDRLKGEALLALDHRVAAEMLLRFHEDLAKAGAAPLIDPPDRTFADPRHRRIPRDGTALEEAVTRFGLSPLPALVLVLEGETEMAVLPLALDAFFPNWRSRVRLMNARGVDANLDHLAAYAGALELGQQHGDVVLLNRPFTRLLVVFDPEGSAATDEDREAKRKRWAQQIQSTLPAPLKTSSLVLDQLLELVEVRSWGAPFEFAHFSNGEIARAVTRIARRRNPKATPMLAQSVAQMRQHRGRLERAWKSLYRGVTKPALGEELWPTLERRLRVAAEVGDIQTIPIGRILVRTSELASLPRHGWILQTQAKSPNDSAKEEDRFNP